MNKIFVLAAAALLMSGCAAKAVGKYHWGEYSSSLYEYQQDPTKQAEYVAALERAVISTPSHQKLAPGLLAELGYIKLSKGDTEGAVQLFEREKAAWPEAAKFMDRAIASARGASGAGSGNATGAAATPTS
ncbi:DUF4810 domain-containing protein [Niveispirillum sp. SYP-B3756]|uniref:DUF4810 domain-containing protein n=1 Tax=Niveispirillum sp. SYP-B3756 TaxID=2662178 RepID=UPI001290C29E|nr:DUF4810 domain-containing protein [Niveispirillum sp. SYP-B3756]MQP63934.1 DUF4810 domain-containing protein [Niveispirillum sp. SYP-B3756]